MRGLAILAFWALTILACSQTAFRNSAIEGAAAFIACALCYWGAAAIAGAVIARRANGYRLFDLAGIGALALLLVAAGVALMWWSGFRLSLFDVRINGVTWALMGAFSALFVVRLQDAIIGNISPKTGRRLP